MKSNSFASIAGAFLISACAAFAAGTATPPPPPPPPPPASSSATPTTSTPAPTTHATVDYGAKCTSLAGQWTTAEAANATNANLGKAKAKAKSGETRCASTKTSDKKKGVADYTSALKLLGVTPTP